METTPAGSLPAPRRPRGRWRDTLYARASMFLLVGGGALVGALITMSGRLVDDSVERLLTERLDLTRTVGGLLERRILGDLGLLAERVAPALRGGGERDAAATLAELREALAAEYPKTLFAEGALLLDAERRTLIELPKKTARLAEVVDLVALAGRAEARRGAVVSPLVRLREGAPPVLVALRPIYGLEAAGPPIAFVGGELQPASADLLREIREVRGPDQNEIDLVDAAGVVVASTGRRTLYRRRDHERTIERALKDRRPLKGRCHRCHDGEEERVGTDVMSFSPLPTLSLGLAVYQAEDAALEPAFDLREQLTMMIVVVALFMLFTSFALRSVVKPVLRLTSEVDSLDAEDSDRGLPSFGRDEVGRLARALDRWRGRMRQAMSELDRSRQASRAEAEATRQHLGALEEIAAQSSMGEGIEAIVATGLRHVLGSVELQAGAMRLRWGQTLCQVTYGLDEGLGARLLDMAEEIDLGQSTRRLTPAGAGRCAVETVQPGLIEGLEAEGIETLGLSSLLAPHGMQIMAVMASTSTGKEIEERWIHSLFYHICMSATSWLLREREQTQQQRQERYLRGVLDAQEEERQRIARDLHDTIAQDLAALRLELERVGRRLEASPDKDAVLALEARTASILRTTRGILLGLRLTVLESMGLLSTLQCHLERVQGEHGIRGALSVDGEERPLDYYLSVALLRIFQECLNNVVQHAEAEQVFATVSFGPVSIGLQVEDDGRGFRGSPGQDQAGLGIIGMRERARLLGGTLTIGSRLGEGTTVSVVVPYNRKPSARITVEGST